MTFVLEQITGGDVTSDAYQFGEILSVSGDFISVRTTTGLEVTVNSNSENYSIGDQIVLGVYGESNLFIIKKLDKSYPTAINYTVSLDTD